MSNKRGLTLKEFIKEVNASGGLLCISPVKEEAPVKKAVMINTWLTMDRRDSTNKIMIDTTTIDEGGIYEFTGNYHIPVKEESGGGEWMLSLRKLCVEDLLTMIQSGRYFLLDLEDRFLNLHLAFNKQKIVSDSKTADITFSCDPFHKDYQAEGFNRFSFTADSKTKITLVSPQTVRINLPDRNSTTMILYVSQY